MNKNRCSALASARLSASAEGARTVDVVCSTDAINAYGYRVDQAGWDLARYEANPVVLYEHNAQAGMGWDAHDAVQSLPIGRAENVRVEDGALRCTIRFASAAVSELAERCYQAFREGMLNAVSVGFTPVDVVMEMRDGEDVPVVRRAELYEVSVVGLPADPGAVRERQSLTLSALRGLAASPKDTSMKTLAALLKIPADKASEGECITAVQPLLTFSSEAQILTGTTSPDSALGVIQGWKLAASRVTEMQAKLAELSADKVGRDVDALIAEGKASGKITPAMEPEIRELAKLSIERARALLTALPVTALGATPPVQPTNGSTSGRKWEDIPAMEKHRMHEDQPELYRELRRDYEKRQAIARAS